MRPHHYIKNLLLFLPLLFSGRMTEWPLLRRTLPGFLAFCFISSVVYIYNDIMDVENDRKHSVKRTRPIASGAVTPVGAGRLAAVLFVLCAACQIPAGMDALFPGAFLLIYLLMNIAYSRYLKHVPIIDVAILAAGFLLRLGYGAALTGINVSGWLFLTVLTMSFYMGLGKRRGELVRQKDTRGVLASYSQSFLDKSMGMCLTLTVAFYSLWAADGGAMANAGALRAGVGGMLWTVPVVIVICLRYSMNLEGDSDGDPVEVVLKDKVLCALALLLVAMIYILLYVAPNL